MKRTCIQLLCFLSICLFGCSLSGDNESYVEPVRHQISLELNGGSFGMTSFEKVEGEYLPIPDYAPTKSGYTFYGWYEPIQKTVYKMSDPYYFDRDTTFYAMWGKSSRACTDHHGSLAVKCTLCKGTGRLPNYIEGKCQRCNGSGKAKTEEYCERCAGFGTLHVHKCNYGHVYQDDTWRCINNALCPYCAEKGKLATTSVYYERDCPDCEDGKIYGPIATCTNCGGDGIGPVQSGTKDCWSCDGTGTGHKRVRCPNCLGEEVFSELEAPTILNATKSSLEIKPVAGCEYGVRYHSSLYSLFDIQYSKFNLSNMTYQDSPVFSNIGPMYSGGFVVAMRKKSTGTTPNVPSKCTIVNDKLDVYRMNEPIAHTHEYPYTSPGLGVYERGFVDSGGCKTGLTGKELSIVMANDPAHDYDFAKSGYSCLPLTYHALTGTINSKDQGKLVGQRVDHTDYRIYSSAALKKFRFDYDSTNKSYKIYNTGTSSYFTAYSTGSEAWVGFSWTKSSYYSSSLWTIMEREGSGYYLYSLTSNSSSYNYVTVYLSMDMEGNFQGTTKKNECYPFLLVS